MISMTDYVSPYPAATGRLEGAIATAISKLQVRAELDKSMGHGDREFLNGVANYLADALAKEETASDLVNEAQIMRGVEMTRDHVAQIFAAIYSGTEV